MSLTTFEIDALVAEHEALDTEINAHPGTAEHWYSCMECQHPYTAEGIADETEAKQRQDEADARNEDHNHWYESSHLFEDTHAQCLSNAYVGVHFHSTYFLQAAVHGTQDHTCYGDAASSVDGWSYFVDDAIFEACDKACVLRIQLPKA